MELIECPGRSASDNHRPMILQTVNNLGKNWNTPFFPDFFPKSFITFEIGNCPKLGAAHCYGSSVMSYSYCFGQLWRLIKQGKAWQNGWSSCFWTQLVLAWFPLFLNFFSEEKNGLINGVGYRKVDISLKMLIKATKCWEVASQWYKNTIFNFDIPCPAVEQPVFLKKEVQLNCWEQEKVKSTFYFVDS